MSGESRRRLSNFVPRSRYASQRQRLRATQLHSSEIMTIVILFQQSHYRTFKAYYTEYVQRHLRSEFPTLVSYSRFVELMLAPCHALRRQRDKAVTTAAQSGEECGDQFAFNRAADTLVIERCCLRLDQVFKRVKQRSQALLLNRSHPHGRSASKHHVWNLWIMQGEGGIKHRPRYC